MKFKSHYPEYGFYVEGKFRQFHGGEYVTQDVKEIEVLKTLSDVEAEEVAEKLAEPKPKANKSSKK